MKPPKEQAAEMVERFKPFVMDNHIEQYANHNAKECASIACDMIIVAIKKTYSSRPTRFEFDEGGVVYGELEEMILPYQKVKEEIQSM